MCRPSCCKPSNEGAGIAAVAAIAGTAYVAVKIGPIVARIVHLVVEVLTLIMLTAASALAAIVLAWLTICIVRWQARRTRARQVAVLRPVPSESQRGADLRRVRVRVEPVIGISAEDRNLSLLNPAPAFVQQVVVIFSRAD